MYYCCFQTTCWYLLIQPCQWLLTGHKELFLPWGSPGRQVCWQRGQAEGCYTQTDLSWLFSARIAQAWAWVGGCASIWRECWQPCRGALLCILSFWSNMPYIKINEREMKLFPQLGVMPCHFPLPFCVIIPAGSSRSAEVEEGTFSLCWESLLSVEICEEIQYPVPLLTTEDMFDTAYVFLDYNFTLQNFYVIMPKKLNQVLPELTMSSTK